MNFCSACGQQLEQNAAFCANCGKQPANNPQTNAPHMPHHHLTPTPSAEQPGQSLALASMVLGIVALVVSYTPLSLFLAIPGVVLAAMAKRNGNKSGMGTAGLVCSIIALAIGFSFFVACSSSLACFRPFYFWW
ncbi:MAG: DUF4190 domain-containing protein [Defluviitaleaceae bacterium]|nr:DUF4190 domain-containing protein [Defluviitaleaceae bacterium]